MRSLRLFTTVALLLFATLTSAGDRRRIDDDWRFYRGDAPGAEAREFDDAEWRHLDLPHDWGVESGPRADAPSEGGGGYHSTGVGWYRKTLKVESSKLRPHPPSARVHLEFEGVYHRAQVWLNGQRLGEHAYGYTPFAFDITDRVRFDKPNVLAVRVDNSQQPNCRWHSGSGIYRHVWLRSHGPVSVEPGSVVVHTVELPPDGGDAPARVEAAFTVANPIGAEVDLQANLTLRDPTGAVAAEAIAYLPPSSAASQQASATLEVPKPQAWSPDSPALYTLSIELAVILPSGLRPIDTHSQRCGLRTITVDPVHGMRLNGESVVLFGGNVHHDHGPLGAASFDDAERRRVRLLKEAGFNAVRTAHNPPSEAFLDACDALGLLVVDEAFDGWRKPKTKHDYSQDFDDHWRADLTAMVARDRRHPSVVAWSIGNEMFERGDESGVRMANDMARLVRELDPSRPVSAGVNGLGKRAWSGLDPLFKPLDIAGYNYETDRFAEDHARLPQRVMMSSESYPADAFQSWQAVSEQPWVVGDFVWTAIDYLGEASLGRAFPPGETPTKPWEADHFPWRGAPCGDLDLLGHRKPISHRRNLVWDRGEKLHVAVVTPADGPWGLTPWSVVPSAASWTWDVERGVPLKVRVDSRWPRVRLELNGRPIGAAPTTVNEEFQAEFTVPYEPGELVVVGLDEQGAEVERTTLCTAGPVERIALRSDRRTAPADRQSLVYIDVELIDAEGRVQPNEDRAVRFRVEGAATLQAVGSTDLTSQESYASDSFTTHRGRAQAILRSTGKPGPAKLTVEGDGAPNAAVTIDFQPSTDP